jgi:hypothetical protein
VLAPIGALVGAVVLWRSPVWSLRSAALEADPDDQFPDLVGEQPIGG